MERSEPRMLLKNARLASGQPVDLLLKDGLIAAMGLDLAADGEEAHPRL